MPAPKSVTERDGLVYVLATGTPGVAGFRLEADSGSVFGWAVGAAGQPTTVGSWGSLPATVAGLAAH